MAPFFPVIDGSWLFVNRMDEGRVSVLINNKNVINLSFANIILVAVIRSELNLEMLAFLPLFVIHGLVGNL